MAAKPPAFQFYANDWLSSPAIMLMTPAEEGAYIRLLAISWVKGGLPDDDEQLAVLSRLGEGWSNGSSTKIRKHFLRRGNKLVNAKQEIVRKKQRQWVSKSRQGGLASAKLRKDKALESENGSTTLQPPCAPNGNTSNFKLQSSTSTSPLRTLKFKKEFLLKTLKKDHGVCFRWFLDKFETRTKRDRNTLEQYAKLCTALIEHNDDFNYWLTETLNDIAAKQTGYPGTNRMFIKALNNKIEKTKLQEGREL